MRLHDPDIYLVWKGNSQKKIQFTSENVEALPR